MRVRTSVTLPQELLVMVDTLAGKKQRRSAIVELALRSYLARAEGQGLNQRDIGIINENAALINEQVAETLEFQAEW